MPRTNKQTRATTKAQTERFSYFLSKKVGKAMTDYKMLDDGDKVLVAVSGGKDSMSLLAILEERRAFVPIKYDLIVVYVDMGHKGRRPRVLEKYFKAHNYNYHIKTLSIAKEAPRERINCFWCSWNRRKVLFQAAEKLGCTKIALGHHKDDIVQTFLLNLIFQGEISAISPRQELFKGKITLIRPLAYVEEKELEQFAALRGFPLLKTPCPIGQTSQRHYVRRLIKKLEKVSPNFKTNIFRSLQRIKREYLV